MNIYQAQFLMTSKIYGHEKAVKIHRLEQYGRVMSFIFFMIKFLLVIVAITLGFVNVILSFIVIPIWWIIDSMNKNIKEIIELKQWCIKENRVY